MDPENTDHNLIIVGKIFIILGLVIIPIIILSYHSIDLLFDSEWFYFENHFEIGFFHFVVPFKLFYIIPILNFILCTLLLASGFGLIYNQFWARKLTMIPAFLLLFHFPIGTALGVFLIYLLRNKQVVIPNLVSRDSK